MMTVRRVARHKVNPMLWRYKNLFRVPMDGEGYLLRGEQLLTPVRASVS